jgi:RNA polymerase sigma-70 factor (ECF subfamily)
VTVASDKIRPKSPAAERGRPEAPADEAALEAAVREHYARIYAVVRRLVGDSAEADDLTQETFWQLYKRPPNQAGRDHNLAGWLYRVATNLGLNALRAGRRRRRYEAEVGWMEGMTQASPDPQAALEEAETRKRVRDALAAMNPRQAQLLALRHSGLAYKEIADALGVAPGSVGTLLARAEREFERRYAAEEG